MASLKFAAAAASPDLLATEVIRRVLRPSVVNLWGSGVTNGDSLGLFLDRNEIMPTGEVNIELTADVVDAQRDQLVFDSVVGRGNLRIPVGAVTTELQGLISVEPIA